MTAQQDIAGKGHSNTPKLFEYVLSSTDYGILTLPDVPEGWEGSELTFIRDAEFKGVLTQFSTNSLKFVKKGRDYIQTAYESKGIDYEITVKIYLLSNSFSYNLYFTGKIDLSTYSIDSIGVSCEIISTGFQDTILNRKDLDVDLLNTKYVGGGEGSMEQIAGMPTSLVIPEYSAQANADWAVLGLNDNVSSGSYNHFMPMTINSTEFASGEVNNQTLGGIIPFFDSIDNHDLVVTGKIIVSFAFEADITGDVSINIKLKKNSLELKVYTNSATDVDEIQFEFDVNEDAGSLVSGDTLSFECIATGTNDYILEYIGNQITISEDLGDTLSEITIDSFPIFEFTARILQLISGVADPLDSEFLGRTDSLPQSYGSDGDGSLMCKTKGLFIRQFITDQLTFNGSLDGVFKTLNGIRNIGLGFETTGGIEKVKIEQESYFFNIIDNPDYPATDTRIYKVNQILDFSDVVTDEIIKKDVIPDRYYNKVNVGYQNFEYENIQGLKEFNTKSNYATPIKSVRNNLDLVSDYRFDTQGVNKLRAKPYSTFPTEDVNGDNDIFGFDVKRVSEFTVKTDEDFIYVSGGVDPSQSYNLDFTPRRNLERHGNRIRSMGLAIGDEIQWLKSDKNTKLVTQKTGESAKAENADLVVNDLTLGYWIPEAYTFEAPVDESTITAIQNNPYGVIKIASDKYGWILEVQTNNEDNKGQFKLLRVDLNNVKVIV